MARTTSYLPGPGNFLQFSTVLTRMGLSFTNRSFDQTEVTAMGGVSEAAANAANSLCMPYQVEAVASLGNGGIGGPNANWTSTSPTFGQINWRQTRLSEFYRAYNSKPVVSASTTGSGNRNTMTLNVAGSNSDAGSPYYFWVETNLGTASGLNSWQSGSPSRSYSFSGVGGGTATIQIWIQDSEGCGNRFDFKRSPNITYP